jgi:serine protease
MGVPLRGVLLVFALAVVVSAIQPAAEPNEVAGRVLKGTLGLPALDRGLRANDMPRTPGLLGDIRRSPDVSPYPAYRPGVVIVKFAGDISMASVDGAAPAYHARAIHRPEGADFDLLTFDSSIDVEQAAAELAARPEVEYAQPAYHRMPMFTPNDPLFAQQWHWPLMGMDRAWDINRGSASSVTVAVVDSGVAFEDIVIGYFAFPFLIGNVMFPALGNIDVPFAAAPDLRTNGRFVAPHDFVWGDDHPVDTGGHGTHVASALGELTDNGSGGAGMAFNVKIMPLKVLSTEWDFIFGQPVIGAFDDDVAAAIRYAADRGAQVINLSLGGPGAAPAIEAAIRYAVSKNAFVVIAAGNSFEQGNPPNEPAGAGGRIDGAITVAAIGQSRNRAFYSSTGSYVEIVAPGGDQRANGSAGGIFQQSYDLDLVETYLRGPAGYGPPQFVSFAFQPFQGTSFSAPQVAGFAALLYSQGITKPAAIEAAIKQFAQDLGPAGRDDEYGYGLIDPRRTLRGLGL